MTRTITVMFDGTTDGTPADLAKWLQHLDNGFRNSVTHTAINCGVDDEKGLAGSVTFKLAAGADADWMNAEAYRLFGRRFKNVVTMLNKELAVETQQ